MRTLAAPLALLALALLPSAAPAQITDRGSARATVRDGGVTLRTGTSGGGVQRCAEVVGYVVSCAPPEPRDGALHAGHLVRPGPRLGPLVIGGLAGTDARRVTVRWPRGAKTMRTRRFGAYLAV